ncbi:BACON domain-containing protein [Streptomyces sp. NPDC055243]|uniref:BACON domain-containing protein n=1 Tax=Streptomyces sp. NPDC055243 TaxID=3365720 RepID=UPI0037CDA4EE
MQATGAHRAHRDAHQRVVPRSVPQAPPARYEPCLDGLFTYCLSVLCDHDAATAALGDVLAIAERRGSRGPAAETELKSWLYALARWVCLRALAEAKRKRQGTHASGSASRVPKAAEPAEPPDETQRQRRRELAQLAWPEAAGTTPEQREALELAVRHQLSPQEVASVIGMPVAKTRDLLASAACEVERTRAALAVVETGTCPIVARLTGDNQLLLGTALRRELVRHVDDCPRCRRTAERAGSGAWPGTAASPAALPVIEAPRAAVHVAMAHVPRARGGGPRFDGRGFPMDPKDHAARRDRMRARAVTTTVVATVVAAPVLALWAAYRGAPLTGEGQDGRSVSASEAESDGANGDRRREDYENAGNAHTPPDPRFTAGSRSPDVSVEVISAGSPPSRSGTGAGRLTVSAQPSGGTTLITLSASGGEPVHWSASTGASWLYLSRSSGTLRPGETFTIRVYVDHAREPAGHWSARVSIAPSGAIISIDGYGNGSGRPTHPGPRPTPKPTPPKPTPPTPDPTPTPSEPDPTPTSPDPTPTPSDPGDSSPPPSDSGDPSPSEG